MPYPPRRPRKPYVRTPDPDANWNAPKIDPKEAVAQCARIIEKIDDAPSHVANAAFDFFEDVREKVASVSETIEKLQRVSDKQQNALNNWEAGVDRWLENDFERD